MIWQPKPGQKVQVRYRKSMRIMTGLHTQEGTVVTVASGQKQKNALVEFNRGYGEVDRFVIPRGNLFAVKSTTE